MFRRTWLACAHRHACIVAYRLLLCVALQFRGFPIPVYGIGSTAGSVGCFLPGANIAPHRKGSCQCIFTSMPDFSSKLVLDGDENANRPTEAAQSVLAGSEHDCSRWGLPTSAGPQMVPSTPLGWLI